MWSNPFVSSKSITHLTQYRNLSIVPWNFDWRRRDFQVKYAHESTKKTQLLRHPKLGASWEGFALEEIIRAHGAKAHQCYFWATHSGAKLDLIIFQRGKRLGFEFKYADAPRLTTSMRHSFATLGLHQLTVIYPGNNTNAYPLANAIEAKGLQDYINSI